MNKSMLTIQTTGKYWFGGYMKHFYTKRKKLFYFSVQSLDKGDN